MRITLHIKFIRVKKTIAIIGATEESGVEIVNRLLNSSWRLLLVSKDSEKLRHLIETLGDKSPSADVEAISCVLDSCWESDIIFVSVPFPEIPDAALKMKQVAVQKIVVLFSDYDLQSHLPNSRIVHVDLLTPDTIRIYGKDNSANKEIKDILISTGYHCSISEFPKCENSKRNNFL